MQVSPLNFCHNFCCAALYVAALFHALVRRDGVFEAMASVAIHDEVEPAKQGRHAI
jgi:hypothetical protein